MAEDQKVTDKSAPLGVRDTNSVRFDFTRLILDFIAKCFYPGIAIFILILLYPAFKQVDVPALLGRLQSAKAGEYEFTFSQAETVGAEIAPLNRKITELDAAITSLRSDVDALQNKVGTAAVSPAQEKAIAVKEQNFNANAQYTALVFHRRESRASGVAVTMALLNAGFVSSDTETDFTELQKVQPTPGVIFITYNATGEQVLSDVKSRIEKLGLQVEVRTNPRPIDLRRGDLQILVF